MNRMWWGGVLFSVMSYGCVGHLDGDDKADTSLDDAGPQDDVSDDVIEDVEDAHDVITDVPADDTTPPPPSGSLDCASIEDVLLCEDFESGSIRSSIWTKSLKNGGAADVSTAQVKQGDYALRITLPPAQGGRGYIYVENVFPVTGNHVFGRVYFYITPEVYGVHNEAFYIGGELTLGGMTGEAVYRLSTGGNNDKFGSRYVHPYITSEQGLHIHGGLKKGAHTMVENQWRCIEWEYDGPNNKMRFWFDGVEETTMTVNGNENPLWKAPPAFQTFYLGYATVQQPQATSYVYYDALVLDTERVGCGTP